MTTIEILRMAYPDDKWSFVQRMSGTTYSATIGTLDVSLNQHKEGGWTVQTGFGGRILGVGKSATEAVDNARRVVLRQ